MIGRGYVVVATMTVMLSPAGVNRAPRPPRGVPVVTITAREFAFDAPDSLAAGPTTIRLVSAGRQEHFVQFVKLSGAHTAAEYLRASRGNQATPWATSVGGVGTIPARGTAAVTLDLSRGRYVLLCDMPDTDGIPHFAKGMARPLTVVAGASPAAEMPAPDASIELTDYAFTLSKPLRAGARVVRVHNAGTQAHMALVWRLHQGKSLTDADRWMNSTGPAVAPVTLAGGVPDLDRQQSAELVLDLVPGRYVLICLVDDVHDHKPHYTHGMMREIVVGPE